MRAWLIGWSCAAVLLVGIFGTVPVARANHQPRATPSATSIVGSPLLQPTIDLVAAQEIALEGQGGAHVVEIDLDGKAGVLTYRIALDTGIDVEIDATTGEIVGTERDEHPDDDTAARQGDDAAAARQGGDDNVATSARRGRHDGDDRSVRRGDRDDDDKLARQSHLDHDDKLARRGHRDRVDDKSIKPASTRFTPGDPCQCAGRPRLDERG